MSNFNSCISKPPQPILSHFIGVLASFSHSYFFFIPSEYIFLICIFLYFFSFLWATQKWVTTIPITDSEFPSISITDAISRS